VDNNPLDGWGFEETPRGKGGQQEMLNVRHGNAVCPGYLGTLPSSVRPAKCFRYQALLRSVRSMIWFVLAMLWPALG